MPDPPTRFPFFLLPLIGALLLAVGARAGPAPVCGAGGRVTLLGADLERGDLLLSSPVGDGTREGGMIVLSIGARSARFVPGGWSGGRQGGSVAPGLVLATQPCGDDCLLVMRWRDGSWHRLGEPLVAPAATSLVETTYDLSGIPWVVLREPGSQAGRYRVSAYRARGREWVFAGGGEVFLTGHPFASPSRRSPRSIAIGNRAIGLDGSSGGSGPPGQPPPGVSTHESQVYRLPDGRPLLVTETGDLYEGREGDAGWLPVRWRPWGGTGIGDGIGTRHWVDVLPDAGSPGARGLVWVDAREPETQRLFLVEWRAGRSPWRSLLELAGGIRTTGGDELPYQHVLRLRDGRWILLAGCVGGPEGPSLAYVPFDGESLGAPRVVPIREP